VKRRGDPGKYEISTLVRHFKVVERPSCIGLGKGVGGVVLPLTEGPLCN